MGQEMILIGAVVICCSVWLVVAIARGWLGLAWLASPTIVAGTVILIGSVFGREFASVNLGPLPLTLDRILWGGMLIQFVALVFLRRIQPLPINTTDLLVIGLMITLTLSTITHDFKYRDNLPLTRLLFFNVMPFGIYFVARHSPIGERQLRWLLFGCSGFAVYLSATAIAEWRDWPQVVFPAYIMDSSFVEFLGRARGPFLNPVVCGIFQIIGVVANLVIWRHVGVRGRILIGLFLPLFLVGVFATFTRSIWLSLAAGVAMTLWLTANWKQRGALLIAGAIAAAVFITVFADDIASFKRDKNVSESDMAESVQLRPLLAEVALNMFIDKPIFGHGFGQYTKAKRLYHQQVTDQPLKKVIPYMQHNVVLSYLTETGLVGTGLLLGIMAVFAMNALRLFHKSARNSCQRGIALLGLNTLLAYFVNGMFHDVSIMPIIGSLFYFMLGLTSHLDATQPRVTHPHKLRWPIADVGSAQARMAS